jgi:hypothetical protein
MINEEKLRAYYYAEPFRPIEIVLADGRRIVVRHAENFGWSTDTRKLMFPAGRDAGESTDFANVVEVRPLAKTRGPGRRRKAS